MRLTSIATQNAKGQPLVDPLFEQGTGLPITSTSQKPTPVTEIQWSSDDGLSATLCLSSSFVNSEGSTTNLTGVSVVLGNVALADQGLSFIGMTLPAVSESSLFVPGSATENRCKPTQPTPFPVHYRPLLPQSPVTQAVTLPLAGSPATPNAVSLLTTGFVSLSDSNGFTCLMVQPDAPLSWPQYFGILASPNIIAPANLDLSVFFNPAGGATGVASPVVLESFANLTLTSAVCNNAALQINGITQFMTVIPVCTTTPTAFPTVPSMFPTAGILTLEDASDTAYLTVQPTNPLSWPP